MINEISAIRIDFSNFCSSFTSTPRITNTPRAMIADATNGLVPNAGTAIRALLINLKNGEIINAILAPVTTLSVLYAACNFAIKLPSIHGVVSNSSFLKNLKYTYISKITKLISARMRIILTVPNK